EPFIDFPPGWGNRAVVDQAFAAAGLDRQVTFEAGQFSMAAGLVRHGLGVAFLPASAAAGFPDLAAVAVTTPEPLRWPVSVATPSARRPGAAARAFVTELQHPAGHQAG
ncbi:MAG: hypothetical protein J2P32_13765, partial [Actinobacteria bacterium]|nr:hypothetical protein [Actinomycetota bacterium]